MSGKTETFFEVVIGACGLLGVVAWLGGWGYLVIKINKWNRG